MAKLSAGQLALLVIVAVGIATVFVATYGLSVFKSLAPLAVILAAVWALACAAVARLSNRLALLSIPAIAAFVLSVVVLAAVSGHHRQFLPFAVLNVGVSAVLVWAAVRFDRRPNA